MHYFSLTALAQLAAVAAVGFAQDEYTTLKHVNHPEHKLMLKHNGISLSTVHPDEQTEHVLPDATVDPAMEEVCPGATPGYTGYLVAGTKHFFFAYFESRSSPATDPLVLWTNGGPGCSGMIGLLTEHGPCRVQPNGSAIVNENSWINTANMIYLEQPLGVGYSYDSSNRTVGTTWMAANDLLIFLDLWYSHFPEHKQTPFHLSGESFAGNYLPIFAKTIRDHNAVSHEEDKIPLESIIIGNGRYDIALQDTSIYNMTCTAANGIGGPVLDQKACAVMESYIQPCRKTYQACEATLQDKECQPALDICLDHGQGAFERSNRSAYDIRNKCESGKRCELLADQTANYMNQPKVQAAFGAADAAVKQWQMCNNDIFTAFLISNYFFSASAPILRDLLDSNFRVLIYHGVFDVVCNYIGAEEVLLGLDWHGADTFNKGSANPITWSGGKYWESENLRYTRVNNAGHFVPANVPQAAQELFQAWLEKRAMK